MVTYYSENSSSFSRMMMKRMRIFDPMIHGWNKNLSLEPTEKKKKTGYSVIPGRALLDFLAVSSLPISKWQ